MSYCDTAFALLEWSVEAVPGLPAYTVPACPSGSNAEPGALAEFASVWSAFPAGPPQVVPGAPG